MRFILRSVFWLSLVFYALPQTQNLPEFSAREMAQQANQAAQQANQTLQAMCAANPQGCLSALSGLAATDLAAVPARINGAKHDPAKVRKGAGSLHVGTLTPEDLAPAWRVPATKM